MCERIKYRRLDLEEDKEILLRQSEDGIRDSVASRGLGDVYKRQEEDRTRSELLGGTRTL